MNTRFATLLVLLACFCIAATTAAVPTSLSPNSTSINTTAAAASSVADSCPDDYTCLGNSETSCNASWIQNSLGCFASKGAGCCAYGLLCVSSTCQTNNFGATCDPTKLNQCLSGAGESLTCNTTSKTCVYLSQAGDSCDDDNNCAPGLTCNSDSICSGASAGQSCEKISCSAGLYCNSTGSCATLGTSGDDCADAQCAVNLYCDGTDPKNSTCKALFTVSSGGACTSSNQCSDGLFCPSGKCVELESNYDKCTANSDCSNGAICVCSHFSGDSYCIGGSYDPSQTYAEDALNCQAENNCPSQSPNTESCFYQNCYSELKDIQSSGCDQADNTFGSCYYSDYCGGFPGWAIALIIIAVIAVVMACVAVVFVAMRRKNTYDSI